MKALAATATANGATSTETAPMVNEVLTLYQQAVTIDPEDFETNFNLGVLYFEHLKDHKRAVHHLKLAISEEDNATA